MFGSTCVLFQGSQPHPAHQQFLAPLDPEYRHFETGGPPRNGEVQDTHDEVDRFRTGRALSSHFDLVIAEGTAALQTLIAYKFLSNRSATTVFLAADETFYEIRDKPTRFLWYGLSPLTSQIDLCISISDLVTEWVSPFLSGVPCRVVHPTTTPEKFENLLAVEARSPEKPLSLLSVGDDRGMKNYLMLVDAVETLNVDRSMDVSLTIVGDGHPEKPYASKEFVSTPGRVPEGEFVRYFEHASAYVQPSLGDGFSVAALEGMLAGLPTIVTGVVGAKQLIADKWVVEPNRDSIARKIGTMGQLSCRERKRIGEENRRIARSFSPSAQTEAFCDAIRSID